MPDLINSMNFYLYEYAFGQFLVLSDLVMLPSEITDNTDRQSIT